MVERVRKFIKENNLLSPEGLHLVALSGGADSVALLCVLSDIGYRVEAVHCNFNLRGDESLRDELFCKTLCDEKGIKLHIVHFDTTSYAQMHGISIEMAARELRYNYFRQLQKAIDAESICVAHHKDDNAETIMLNIVRGTGIKGIAGMRPKNGDIVRPFLCITRNDIADYLTAVKQKHITDSSNLVDDVKRNYIRLNILPELKKLNPSLVEAFSKTSSHIASLIPLIDNAAEFWISSVTQSVGCDAHEPICSVDIEKLKSSPSPEYILFRILEQYNIPSATITQIAEHIDSQTGKYWECKDKTVTINRGNIVIENKKPHFTEKSLPIEGTYVLSNEDRITVESCMKDGDFAISRDPYCIQLDAHDIKWPLVLREVQKGDRFVPFGMKGSKLVSDFLTDNKLTIQQKRRQLCLTDAENNILWVVGLRINNRFRITPNTIKTLRLRYIIKTE